MKITVATCRIKPEKAELYERTFLELKDLVEANEPGTTFFQLTKDPSQPNTYLVFEAYRDADAVTEHVTKDYYDRTARIFVECLDGDHVEQAKRLGHTDPREAYKLADSLKLARYDTI